MNGDLGETREYVVLTMCHCDEFSDDGEPDCWGHWSVGIPVSGYRPETGNVAVANDMTEGFKTREDAQLFADAKNRRVHQTGGNGDAP